MFNIRWDMPNKLKAGFAGIILFMVVIAGMGWYSAKKLVSIERIPRLARELEIRMLECRREEKNIIIRGVLLEYITKWRNSFSRVKAIGNGMESRGLITYQEKRAFDVKINDYEKTFNALVQDIKNKRVLNTEKLNAYDRKFIVTGRSILTVGDKIVRDSVSLSKKIDRQTFVLLLYVSVFGVAFSIFLGYVTTRIVHKSMREIENLTHELENASMELALGLSEHFEVLRRVAEGDLSVRSPEESKNELLAKLGVVINKTINKLVENARGEVEQIYTAAASGIRVIDTNFNVIRVNRAMEKLSGVNREEALKLKCYQQLKSPICDTNDCILRQVLSGKEEIEIEVEEESIDGRRMPCLIKAMPFRDTKGNIVGVIEDIRDITQLKEFEKELGNSNMELALGLSEHFEVLRRVAEGDFTIKAPEKSKNELLAKLGAVINKMSSNLKKNMEELEETKTGLEKQVRERTKQLEEAKNSLKQRVKERTVELEKYQRELQKRVKELEDFSKVAVGRELRMIELEEEIEKLKDQIKDNSEKGCS